MVRSAGTHPSNRPTVDPERLRTAQPSSRPIVDPERSRSVPSASTRPIVDPEAFRMVPAPSTRPIVDPEASRTTPPASYRPIVDPEAFRKVPSSSTRPMDDPLPSRTVIDDHAHAGAATSASATALAATRPRLPPFVLILPPSSIMPTLYQYDGCSTCRNARKWLDRHAIAHTTVPIVQQPPDARQLRAWQERSGIPLRRLFNTSGESWRKGGFSTRLPSMTPDEAFDALAADGKLIRRPLLVLDDGGLLVGFDEAAWAVALGVEVRP